MARWTARQFAGSTVLVGRRFVDGGVVTAVGGAVTAVSCRPLRSLVVEVNAETLNPCRRDRRRTVMSGLEDERLSVPHRGLTSIYYQ